MLLNDRLFGVDQPTVEIASTKGSMFDCEGFSYVYCS